MGIFTHWPYTNLHELNLDWILKICRKLDISLDEFKKLTNDELENIDDRIDALNRKIDESQLPEVVKEELRELIESGEMGEIVQKAILKLGSEIKYHIGYGGSSQYPTGAGFWVETGEGVIINDLGVHTENIIQSIKDAGKTDIIAIIISHYHEDHMGDYDNDGTPEGLYNLLNDSYFNFDNCKAYLPHNNLIWNNFLPSSAPFINIQTREEKTKLALEEKGIEIVYPEENDFIVIDEELTIRFNNLRSDYFAGYYTATTGSGGDVTQYTQYNNFSMITTYEHVYKLIYAGDIHKEGEENNYKLYNNCNVYFAPHHGINRPISLNYLNNIEGDIVIIPTGFTHYQTSQIMHADVQKLVAKGAIPIYTCDAENIIITDSIYGLEYYVENNIILDTDYSIDQNYGFILYDDDLNELKLPMSWNTQNGTIAQRVANTPFTRGGYKGETIRAKATRGYIQRAQLSNDSFHTMAARSYDYDSNTWRDWRYLNYVKDQAVRGYVDKSNSYFQDSVYGEFDSILNKTYFERRTENDSFRQNYLVYANGVLSIGLDLVVKSNAPDSTRILTWTGTERIGGIVWLYDRLTKTPYAARITYSGGDRYLALSEAIPEGAHIQGCITLQAMP